MPHPVVYFNCICNSGRTLGRMQRCNETSRILIEGTVWPLPFDCCYQCGAIRGECYGHHRAATALGGLLALAHTHHRLHRSGLDHSGKQQGAIGGRGGTAPSPRLGLGTISLWSSQSSGNKKLSFETGPGILVTLRRRRQSPRNRVPDPVLKGCSSS
jgi:hypothetical protein